MSDPAASVPGMRTGVVLSGAAPHPPHEGEGRHRAYPRGTDIDSTSGSRAQSLVT